ncbi:MAG: glycoside hydrolase family 5 protein [Pirellulaceae bacterium]
MRMSNRIFRLVALWWGLVTTPELSADPAANVPSAPPARLALELNQGICIDRQFRTIPPEPIMRFTRDDIRLIKSMGFKFVKLIVNPEPLMTDNRLDSSKGEYLQQMVAQVVEEGLPVVFCIHPEWEFKRKILSDRAEFARFLPFLQDVGELLAARWNPDVLALQLMTEPVTDAIAWNELQPQLWEVARRTMPGHTLILAGDQVGRIEGLITTEPVDDANVMYSFTFYDPFLFTLQGAAWLTPKWWSQLGLVPYPSSPEIIDAHLSSVLDGIPPEPAGGRTTVGQHLKDYGTARWNEQALAARIGMLTQWNETHGGRLRILCAEFGCYQQTVDPEHRCRYLHDVRTAFEANGIGWAYWSYNETFTIMTPDRTPFGPAGRQTPDRRLLEALLGK